MRKSTIPASVIRELRKYFHCNGYVRPPLEKRAGGYVRGRFRRGYEIRLTADSKDELRHIRALLRRAKFKPGRPFVKANQYRQPIYGRQAMERFLSLVGERKRKTSGKSRRRTAAGR